MISHFSHLLVVAYPWGHEIATPGSFLPSPTLLYPHSLIAPQPGARSHLSQLTLIASKINFMCI